MEVKEGKWEEGLLGKTQSPFKCPAKTISIFSLNIPNSAIPFVFILYTTQQNILKVIQVKTCNLPIKHLTLENKFGAG